MLLNILILAISSSIDSLGIGITYGIKNTKIIQTGKVILFIISLITSITSTLIGNKIQSILSSKFCNILGSSILFLIGIFILYNALKQEKSNSKNNNIFKNPMASDFDKSNTIDLKETLFLGIALSLDSFCIGIGGGIINTNPILFPITVSIFQILFLSTGTYLGKKINNLCTLPENIWSIISATLLVLIGFIKIVFNNL